MLRLWLCLWEERWHKRSCAGQVWLARWLVTEETATSRAARQSQTGAVTPSVIVLPAKIVTGNPETINAVTPVGEVDGRNIDRWTVSPELQAHYLVRADDAVGLPGSARQSTRSVKAILPRRFHNRVASFCHEKERVGCLWSDWWPGYADFNLGEDKAALFRASSRRSSCSGQNRWKRPFAALDGAVPAIYLHNVVRAHAPDAVTVRDFHQLCENKQTINFGYAHPIISGVCVKEERSCGIRANRIINVSRAYNGYWLNLTNFAASSQSEKSPSAWSPWCLNRRRP